MIIKRDAASGSRTGEGKAQKNKQTCAEMQPLMKEPSFLNPAPLPQHSAWIYTTAALCSMPPSTSFFSCNMHVTGGLCLPRTSAASLSSAAAASRNDKGSISCVDGEEDGGRGVGVRNDVPNGACCSRIHFRRCLCHALHHPIHACVSERARPPARV